MLTVRAFWFSASAPGTCYLAASPTSLLRPSVRQRDLRVRWRPDGQLRTAVLKRYQPGGLRIAAVRRLGNLKGQHLFAVGCQRMSAHDSHDRLLRSNPLPVLAD